MDEDVQYQLLVRIIWIQVIVSSSFNTFSWIVYPNFQHSWYTHTLLSFQLKLETCTVIMSGWIMWRSVLVQRWYTYLEWFTSPRVKSAELGVSTFSTGVYKWTNDQSCWLFSIRFGNNFNKRRSPKWKTSIYNFANIEPDDSHSLP